MHIRCIRCSSMGERLGLWLHGFSTRCTGIFAHFCGKASMAAHNMTHQFHIIWYYLIYKVWRPENYFNQYAAPQYVIISGATWSNFRTIETSFSPLHWQNNVYIYILHRDHTDICSVLLEWMQHITNGYWWAGRLAWAMQNRYEPKPQSC